MLAEEIQRLRQIQGPEAVQAAEGLLALLDRSPWMRREVSLRDLSFLQGLAKQRYAAEARELAEWHASSFNLFLDAGLAVSVEDMEDAAAELDGTGWRLNYERGWRAERGDGGVVVGGEDCLRYAAEDWKHEPGPRSKRRWVSKTGRVVYSDTNPGEAKTKKPAAAAPAADAKALISQHKPEGEWSAADRTSAKRSFAALLRHHGDLVKERINVMAADLQKAHGKAKDAATKAAVSKKIAKLGLLLEHVDKGGDVQPDLAWDNIPEALPVREAKPAAPKVANPPVSAEVAGAVARDVANDKASQKGEPAPFKSDAKPAAPKSPAKAAPSKAAPKAAPAAKVAPSEVQEAAEIPDAKPASKPAAKPAAPPPAASNDDDWGTTQVEPGSAESISSTLQMDPQGDGVSERLDKVFDQIKSEVPNLTTAKWKAFLQKAWDTKAVELQGINEVRHIHAAGGMDKVPIKSSGGMDRVLAYAIVKDPKKLQSLIQSDLLGDAPAEPNPAPAEVAARAKRLYDGAVRTTKQKDLDSLSKSLEGMSQKDLQATLKGITGAAAAKPPDRLRYDILHAIVNRNNDYQRTASSAGQSIWSGVGEGEVKANAAKDLEGVDNLKHPMGSSRPADGKPAPAPMSQKAAKPKLPPVDASKLPPAAQSVKRIYDGAGRTQNQKATTADADIEKVFSDPELQNLSAQQLADTARSMGIVLHAGASKKAALDKMRAAIIDRRGTAERAFA